MAIRHSTIPAFPANEDRQAFGNWLSGLTDGEGCFDLRLAKNKPGTRRSPKTRFRLSLRQDDCAVLRMIQAFWACGVVVESHYENPTRNSRPQAEYIVTRHNDILNVVIPHFDKFPLHAKKKRDFLIWKEAALLIASVMIRPFTQRGYRLGVLPKWKPEETKYVTSLLLTMREQRKYAEQPPDITPPTLPQELPGLFD